MRLKEILSGMPKMNAPANGIIKQEVKHHRGVPVNATNAYSDAPVTQIINPMEVICQTLLDI